MATTTKTTTSTLTISNDADAKAASAALDAFYKGKLSAALPNIETAITALESLNLPSTHPMYNTVTASLSSLKNGIVNQYNALYTKQV